MISSLQDRKILFFFFFVFVFFFFFFEFFQRSAGCGGGFGPSCATAQHYRRTTIAVSSLLCLWCLSNGNHMLKHAKALDVQMKLMPSAENIVRRVAATRSLHTFRLKRIFSFLSFVFFFFFALFGALGRR